MACCASDCSNKRKLRCKKSTLCSVWVLKVDTRSERAKEEVKTRAVEGGKERWRKRTDQAKISVFLHSHVFSLFFFLSSAKGSWGEIQTLQECYHCIALAAAPPLWLNLIECRPLCFITVSLLLWTGLFLSICTYVNACGIVIWSIIIVFVIGWSDTEGDEFMEARAATVCTQQCVSQPLMQLLFWLNAKLELRGSVSLV